MMDSSLSTSCLKLFSSSSSQISDCGKLVSDEPTLCQQFSTVVEGFHETIEENITITNEYQDLFKTLDLNCNGFTPTTKTLLEELKVIEGEDLVDLDETSFRLTLIEKNIAEKKRIRMEDNRKREYLRHFANFSKLDEKLQMLLEATIDMESDMRGEFQNMEYGLSNRMLLECKIRDYTTKIEEMKLQMEDYDFENIMSENILRQMKEYSSKKGELVMLNEALDYYKDLPADLLEAKVALERKQKEYEEVKRELERKMNQR